MSWTGTTCPTALSKTVFVAAGDTFSLTRGAAVGFRVVVVAPWEAELAGTVLTVPTATLAPAAVGANGSWETLVAPTLSALIAVVIGLAGRGGGGMAHGASVGRHSTNKRRVDI